MMKHFITTHGNAIETGRQESKRKKLRTLSSPFDIAKKPNDGGNFSINRRQFESNAR
jgi:hypothetical protein